MFSRNTEVTHGGHQIRSLTELRVAALHYHGERNHQGLDNELIDRPPRQTIGGPVRRRARIGGLLSYYYCAAA